VFPGLLQSHSRFPKLSPKAVHCSAGRSTRQQRNRQAEQSVDSFFAFLREYVAEPLAEGMQQSSSSPEDGEIDMDL